MFKEVFPFQKLGAARHFICLITARFKLYQGATPDKRDPFVMFECIDGAGMGQMICVTEKGDLSSRVSV